MSDGGQERDLGGKRRFAAFISYAHADAAIAAKLQGKLERYRLPKRIAEARSGGEAALGQIFRDREDLAAAPSLSEAIRAAIAEAEALVVLCSPDAKESRWVGEEIALFRALHPDGAVLAALVRGEPGESFPAALTEGGTEPLAADLRAEGDGEALGFLKIVAGIAGVPLDALVQRDAQRRLRRVTAITVGALAAMLIMGIMTAFAFQQRNEAARQRAASDGLVEYMLTDLREKLRGVGRTEIMDAVNERALQHYASQGDLELLPDDSLEHRARVLHAMGEDDMRNGKLDRALLRFNESYATTAALLQREPHNPDRIFAHAQSEYYVGRLAFDKGNRNAARKHWLQYLVQAKALASFEPASFRSHMELGYAEGNLCELGLDENFDASKTEAHCRNAIKHEVAALAINPNDLKTQQDIANRWGWLARIQIAQRRWQDAIESRRTEAAIMDRLVNVDPLNVEYAIRRSWASIGLGVGQIGSGNAESARKEFRNALLAFDAATRHSTGDSRVVGVRLRLLSYRAKSELLSSGSIAKDTQAALEQLFAGPHSQSLRLGHRKIMEEKLI